MSWLRTGEVGGPSRRTARPGAALGSLRVGRGDGEAGAGRTGSRAQRAGHASRQVEAGEARAGPAGQVAVGVDEVCLFCGGGVAGVRLDAGIEAACPVGGELWDGDRGEDADDRDHDQQLDQGETFRLLLLHLGALAAHTSSLLDGCWSLRTARLGRTEQARCHGARVCAASGEGDSPRPECHESNGTHQSMTAPSWKIGRYMEMTRPPITTPRKRITAGSRSDIRLATVLSTSSS